MIFGGHVARVAHVFVTARRARDGCHTKVGGDTPVEALINAASGHGGPDSFNCRASNLQ